MAIPNKRTVLVCGGLALCNVVVAAGAQAQGVSFIARWDFDAGREPQCVAVGDFNSDGLQDLAVVNLNSGNVSVLLGNGDGSFQAARNNTCFPARPAREARRRAAPTNRKTGKGVQMDKAGV